MTVLHDPLEGCRRANLRLLKSKLDSPILGFTYSGPPPHDGAGVSARFDSDSIGRNAQFDKPAFNNFSPRRRQGETRLCRIGVTVDYYDCLSLLLRAKYLRDSIDRDFALWTHVGLAEVKENHVAERSDGGGGRPGKGRDANQNERRLYRGPYVQYPLSP
jgi:hypothetical protein